MITKLYSFLSMGGYAMYVWPAYAITLSTLSINVIAALLDKRKTYRLIKHYLNNKNIPHEY